MHRLYFDFRFSISLLVLSSTHARAGTHYWSGLGSDDNWKTGNNWTSGIQPVPREAGAVVLVFPAGALQPDNVCNIPNLGVDSIVINGSNYGIDTSSPTLPITLRGNGNSLYSAGTNNRIYGPLVLGSQNLNFGTPTGAQLRVFSVMSGSGGFNKVGQGDVIIEGSQDNTYTGTTTVLGGALHLARSGGHVAIGGDLVIGDTAGSSVPNSGIDSKVILDAEQQLLFGAAVTVNPDGLLDMHGHSMAVGSLSMIGNSKIDSFTGPNSVLTLLGDVASSNPTDAGFTPDIHCDVSLGGATRTFTVDGVQHDLGITGKISGGGANGGIIKTGQGTLTLYGVSGYTGDTVVNAGTLYVFGSQQLSKVILNPGGTLTGNGSTGAVQSIGGTIVPSIYVSGPSISHLQTKNLAADPTTTLKILIDDQYLSVTELLTVTGNVNLGGCRLEAGLDASGGLSPAIGDSFVMIQNDFGDPVIGTFDGLPEGAQFKFSGRLWQITYHGGDGNDVVLTLKSLQLPLSLDSITLDPVTNYVVLRGNGDPNEFYVLQRSTDLVVWKQTGQIYNTLGNLVISYPMDQPSRFFRFMKP